MNRLKTLVFSKTVWGVILTAAAWLMHQDQMSGALTGTDWSTAIGMVITGVGVRDAIHTTAAQGTK